MIALIIGIISAIFFILLSIAAMNKSSHKISLFFVYLAIGSLLVGLVSYVPFNSFVKNQDLNQQRKISQTNIEIEQERARKMISTLNGVDNYIKYLSLVESKSESSKL